MMSESNLKLRGFFNLFFQMTMKLFYGMKNVEFEIKFKFEIVSQNLYYCRFIKRRGF